MPESFDGVVEDVDVVVEDTTQLWWFSQPHPSPSLSALLEEQVGGAACTKREGVSVSGVSTQSAVIK